MLLTNIAQNLFQQLAKANGRSPRPWLKLRRGSSVLAGRQRKAFEILVTQLQKKRLPDGTPVTLGQVFGLSLLLALKVQNQPLVPPPPVNVPRNLINRDEA